VLAVVLFTACGLDADLAGRAGPATCDERAGETIEHTDPALDTAANRALVHLPPCYDDTDDRYPVVSLLHGGRSTAEMQAHPGNHDLAFVADRFPDWRSRSSQLRRTRVVLAHRLRNNHTRSP